MCSSCWAEKKEAHSLKRKAALVGRSGKPLPAALCRCCHSLGAKQASSSYHALWTFLKWGKYYSLLAKPLLWFALLLLIMCASFCHTAFFFFLAAEDGAVEKSVTSISMADVLSVYKRVQNCFYQTYFFCHCFLMTDTTLNLHSNNTLRWEICVAIDFCYGDKSWHILLSEWHASGFRSAFFFLCHSFSFSVPAAALPKLICSFSIHSSRLINSITRLPIHSIIKQVDRKSGRMWYLQNFLMLHAYLRLPLVVAPCFLWVGGMSAESDRKKNFFPLFVGLKCDGVTLPHTGKLCLQEPWVEGTLCCFLPCLKGSFSKNGGSLSQKS